MTSPDVLAAVAAAKQADLLRAARRCGPVERHRRPSRVALALRRAAALLADTRPTVDDPPQRSLAYRC